MDKAVIWTIPFQLFVRHVLRASVQIGDFLLPGDFLSLSFLSCPLLLGFTGNFLYFPNWESVWDFSHCWEIVGTTFSSHGKRLVKVWVYFSQCWVHFGKWSEIYFKIPMLGIQWVFSPEYGKMMGLFFHKLGNISTCYSQFWEMQGTRNPHLGKGLVKVRVTFSRYRV